MKKLFALIMACVMLMTGCASNSSSESTAESSADSTTTAVQTTTETTKLEISPDVKSTWADARSEEYVTNLGFWGLNDPNLSRYIEDTVYYDLVNQLPDDYFVENIETSYYSKEYLEELEFNSQVNVYFGYTQDELDEQFQGTRYVFTLSDAGETVVQPFEVYEEVDNTYNKVLKNVLIGTGVILLCVTVSAVSAGAGAPAISMIFAASAKSAAVIGLESGVFSGVAAGIVTGIQTGDFDEALKAAALAGSEGFKQGAITGAITGGVSEYVGLKGATTNGLTMNQAATIQKETKWPLDVIKQFKNMEQFDICKNAGLTAEMINGKVALIRQIDLSYIDEATGLSNLELMQQGKAAIDPISKLPYELHHIGQKADSTLAILTKAEHMQGGNNKIWHEFGKASEAHAPGNTWDKQRAEFWINFAKMIGG